MSRKPYYILASGLVSFIVFLPSTGCSRKAPPADQPANESVVAKPAEQTSPSEQTEPKKSDSVVPKSTDNPSPAPQTALKKRTIQLSEGNLIAIGPEGTKAAIRTRNTIEIRNIVTGKVDRTLPFEMLGINEKAVFSSDGKQFASGSVDVVEVGSGQSITFKPRFLLQLEQWRSATMGSDWQLGPDPISTCTI